MKTIKFLCIVFLAALVGSCNKTLDPNVYSSLTNTNAFNTVSDAIAAVNAVYARLKGPVVGDNFDYWTVRHFALTDLTTDVGHCSYGGDPGQLSLAQWNSSNGLLAEDWRQIYKLIFYCHRYPGIGSSIIQPPFIFIKSQCLCKTNIVYFAAEFI